MGAEGFPRGRPAPHDCVFSSDRGARRSPDPRAYLDAKVTATARLIDAVRRAGFARIVFGSSSSVYGNATPAPFADDQPAGLPISPYAASKRAGELLAHAFAHLYPLKIICLRFFTVYGPRQRPDLAIHKFTDLIARGRPVRMHGDGSSERDYTYITDCLDGILAALHWTAAAVPGPGETVNLGRGERLRTRITCWGARTRSPDSPTRPWSSWTAPSHSIPTTSRR